MKKRMLSVFLSLCMILTLLPTALAVDEPESSVDSASQTEIETAEETAPDAGTLGEETTEITDAASLAQALGGNEYAVAEGNTVTLQQNVTLTPDNPINIPDGVTLDVPANVTLALSLGGNGDMKTFVQTFFSSKGAVRVHAGGVLNMILAQYIGGGDAYYNLTEGTATLSEFNVENGSFRVTIESGSSATCSKNTTLQPGASLSSYGIGKNGGHLTVEENATLKVTGGLRGISSDSPSNIVVNGTLDLTSGLLSMAAKATMEVGANGKVILGEKGFTSGSLTSGFTEYTTSGKITITDGGCFVSLAENTKNPNLAGSLKAASSGTIASEQKDGDTYYYVEGHKPPELAVPAYTFEVTQNTQGNLTANQRYNDEVRVTLKSAADAETVAKALIRFEINGPEDSNPHVYGTDSNEQEWDLVQTKCWGPAEGFQIGQSYDVTTPFDVVFDVPGTYTGTFTLVDLSKESDAVLATGKVEITVVAAPEPTETGITVTDADGQPVDGTFETVADALEAENAATITLNAAETEYVLFSTETIAEQQKIVVSDGATLTIKAGGEGAPSTGNVTDMLTSTGAIDVQAGGVLKLPKNTSGSVDTWIGGTDARLNLTDGSATFQFSGSLDPKVGKLTVNGNATVPTGENAIMYLFNIPMDGEIAPGKTLTVNGTLTVYNGGTLDVKGGLTVAESGKVDVQTTSVLNIHGGASFTYKGVNVFGASEQAQPAARSLMPLASGADSLFTVSNGAVQVGFDENGNLILTIPNGATATVNDQAEASKDSKIGKIVVADGGTVEVPQNATLTLDGIPMEVAPTASLTGNGTVEVIGEGASLSIQGSEDSSTAEGTVSVSIATDDESKVTVNQNRDDAGDIESGIKEIVTGIKVYAENGDEILNNGSAFTSVADALKAPGAVRIVLGQQTDAYTLDTSAVIQASQTLEIQDGATLKVTVAADASSSYPRLDESEGTIKVEQGGILELPSETNPTTSTEVWIGKDDNARLNLTSGSAEFKFDSAGTTNAGTLTLNGNATVPSSKTAIMHLNNTPINGIIAEGYTLTVNGTLKAVNGSSDDAATRLLVNGTLNVADNGMLTIANRSTVAVTGTLTLPLMSKNGILGTSDSTGLKGDIQITGDQAKVTYGSYTVLGENAMLTLSQDGQATMKMAAGELSLEKGTATVNAYNGGDVNALLVTSDPQLIPLQMTIGAGTTLNIPKESKGLNLPNDSSLTVNGTVNVENTLTVHSTAALTSGESGVVNVKGISGLVDIKHGNSTDGTVTAKMSISDGGQIAIAAGRTDSETIADHVTGGSPVKNEDGSWTVKASGITVTKADGTTVSADSVKDALAVENAKTITLAANAAPYVLALADNDTTVIPENVTIVVNKDATFKITTTSQTPDLLTDSKGAITVMAGGVLELPSDISSNTAKWIGGTDARLNLTGGSATFAFAGDGDSKIGTLTLNGNAEVPSGKTAIMHLGGIPMDGVIDQGKTLTVNGTLKAISGTQEDGSELTVNGTLTVTGTLSVAQKAQVMVGSTGSLSLPVMSKADMSTNLKGDLHFQGGAKATYAGVSILGGSDPYLTLAESGSATLNVSDANVDGTASLSLDNGSATVNTNLKAFLVSSDSTGNIIPFKITTAAGTTLTIPAGKALSIPNGGSLTANGTLNVNGALELHSASQFTGKANVYRIVAVYGDNVIQTGSDLKLSATGSRVLAQSDISAMVSSISGKTDATDKTYTSIVDAVGEVTFANGWTYAGPQTGSFTVTFDANGGTVNGGNTATMTTDAFGTLTSFPTATHSGSYAFDGWYTAVNGGSLVSAPHTFTENTNLYAHWTYTGGGSSGGGGGGGSSSSGSYAITVDKTTGGTVKVSPTRADKGDTVTITVDPNTGYELDKLTVTDKDGDTVKLTNKGNDKYTFTMPGSKVTVEATFVKVEEPADLPFYDVSKSAYYYDAVKWAVEQGITSGTSATTFAPDMTCTRAQVVTFLWRANGSPAPKTASNPFVDVAAGSYYYDAVLWAVEQGITSGTSATTFAPDMSCTRAQVATFLWRAEGSPAASGSNPFVDVVNGAYYADAVLWAAQNGVTSGTSVTTFAPDMVCTRAQIVTFLYRALAE